MAGPLSSLPVSVKVTCSASAENRAVVPHDHTPHEGALDQQGNDERNGGDKPRSPESRGPLLQALATSGA